MAQPYTLTLNNMALAVADLAAMSDWYCRVLGLKVVDCGRFDAVGADYVMLAGAGFRLELVSRGSPAVWCDRTAPPEHLDILGYKAIVLDTTDLAATTCALTDAGADLVWSELELAPGWRSTMVRDPEGNLINIFGERTS